MWGDYLIVEAMLNFMYSTAAKILGILPDTSPNIVEFFTNTITTFEKIMNGLNYWLPLKALITFLIIIIVVQNFQLILWVLNWIIRRIADIIP